MALSRVAVWILLVDLVMLKIKLRASWRLAAVLLIAHGAAIALIVVVSIPQWLGLVAATALILSCLVSVRRTGLLLAPASTISIEISSDDVLTVQTRRGEWIECEVLASTYVASFLTVLNLREVERERIRHVVVLSDSIDAENFRNLRVWLRWKHASQPS